MRSLRSVAGLTLLFSASWGCGESNTVENDAATVVILPDAVTIESDAGVDAPTTPDAGPSLSTWEPAEVPALLLRWGASVAPGGDGRFYLFAGFGASGGGTNDVLLADTRGATAAITAIPTTNAPPTRSRACAAYDPVSQRLIIRGGRAGASLNDGKTWALDTTTNAWSEIDTDDSPPGIVGCSMTYVASDRAIYHFGGAFDDPSFDWSNQLWRFDLETNTWSRVTTEGAAPSRGYDGQLASHEGTLYLFGGGIGVGGDGIFGSDVYTFDVASRRWSLLEVSGPRPDGRRGHWMLLSDDAQRILIGGGEGSEGPLDDVWLFDRAGGTWRNLSSSVEEGRFDGRGIFGTVLPGPGDATATLYSGLTQPSAAPSEEAWVLRLRDITF
jgi:hypothetical protein